MPFVLTQPFASHRTGLLRGHLVDPVGAAPPGLIVQGNRGVVDGLRRPCAQHARADRWDSNCPIQSNGKRSSCRGGPRGECWKFRWSGKRVFIFSCFILLSVNLVQINVFPGYIHSCLCPLYPLVGNLFLRACRAQHALRLFGVIAQIYFLHMCARFSLSFCG